jgi:hypothetical protein
MAMRKGTVFLASLLLACGAPPRPVPPEPKLAVGPQPWGLKRCEAAPYDYPDPEDVPRPARVAFAGLPLDPVFQAMGVSLITFRSAELVFHASPDLPQAMVDCAVAAADDGVAFATRTFSVPRVFDGGPTRDLFLLSPDTSLDVLERLDPGYGLDVDTEGGEAFVGHLHDRPEATAIFQWKRLPVSYLDLGAMYAHEWTHMIQRHVRGNRPGEMTGVVEGEANLVGALFRDAVLPGAGTAAWDWDARLLAGVSAQHPELTPYELITQRPHRYHQELTLFAYLSRAVDPPTLARVRLLARAERVDYASAWKRVVGRDLLDRGLDNVVRSPALAPRPPLPAGAPRLTVVRSEDRLWLVTSGWKPGEKPARTLRGPDGQATTDAVEADTRGAIAWSVRIGQGTGYAPHEVELRGDSGACSAKYFVRTR